MIRIPRFVKTLLFSFTRKTVGSIGGKPAAILLVLCLASPFISCGGKEVKEPAVNKTAGTTGTSASESEGKSESGAASDSSRMKFAELSTEHPPGHIAPSSLDSESWFLVTKVNAERKFTVYVDTSTINTIDGEVYSWSKLVFDEDQKDTDGLVYRDVLIASAVDCTRKTYEYKSSKFYNSLGKMVYMENIEGKTSKIPANSVSNQVAEFVCGYNPNEAKTVKPQPGVSQQE
jgi:hypothetical protein